MCMIAQSLEQAQIYVVIYKDFRKKTVFRFRHIKSCDCSVLKLPYRNDSTIAEFLLRRD